MNINPVKQRSRDTFLLFGNDSMRARTGLLWVGKVPAWAGAYTIGYLFSVRYKKMPKILGALCPRLAILHCFMGLTRRLLNFGSHVVTKPIEAQIMHEFFEFFASYWLY